MGSKSDGRTTLRIRTVQPTQNRVNAPHTLHASWLNQIEIYFSIVQRKVLEPNDFESIGKVARTLNAFEHHWSRVAQPFDWHFTRQDLEKLMQRLTAYEPQLQLAA